MRVVWLAAISTSCGHVTRAIAQAPAKPPTPLEVSVSIGAPPRQISLRGTQTEEGLQLAEGPRKATLGVLPIANATALDAENVSIGVEAVAIVRAKDDEGHSAAAVLARTATGAVRVVWSGATDPRGDPGERRWSSITTTDVTADAKPEVVIADHAERVAACGLGAAAMSQRIVRARGVLEPRPTRVELPKVDATLSAQRVSPGPTAPPLIDALRVVGATFSPDDALRARSLADGSLQSQVELPAPRMGRDELIVLSIDTAGRPLRAIAFVPRAASEQASAPKAFPIRLRLAGDRESAFDVVIPPDVAPGERVWIVPATPLAWRCLAIAIDEVHVPAAASAGALSEVEVYTDLDFGGDAASQLARELDQAGSQAARAAELLARLGQAGAAAIEAALPKLSPEGRARAARALGSQAARVPRARSALEALLGDPDERVRSTALEGLLAAGPEHAGRVASRIAVADPLGDRAALAVARAAPMLALPAVLSAIEQAGGSRPKLRDALASATEGGGAAALDAVRRWHEAPGPGSAARASVALALASLADLGGVPALVGDIVIAAHASTEEFEDLYRLVLAAKVARPANEIDAWLARLARNDERWMLRSAALEALAARKASEATQVARAALGDPYPRVRVAAATLLASDAGATEALVTHARRDRWAMVRAAAVAALSGRAAARKAIEQALEDPASQVRVAAIDAFTRAGTRDAFPLIEARMRNEHEMPEVVAAAIAHARGLCLQAAKDTLLVLLSRGFPPTASSSDAELSAQAFDALVDLGGASAEAALAATKSQAVPPGFRTRAAQAAKRLAAGQNACALPPAAQH